MVEHIGRYQIIETLGRGGMGVVYKAIDPNLERIVAIKCLNDDLSDDERVVARFLREARNVAALSHPNSVRLYFADEQDGKPYLVMEYVDGETLADRLRKNGPLPQAEAERILRECAQALAAADEKNIVHRDIKPGNIMLDRSGRTLLTDFGIAQVQYGLAEKGSDTIMGTPGYMPPELLHDGRSDRRGDIFALGAVYFEMLTGQRLIESRDLSGSNKSFADPEFPRLDPIREQFGELVYRQLGRMLHPDPAQRYADYKTLLEELAPEQQAEVERAREAAPTAVLKRATTTDTPATVSLDTKRTASPPDTRTVSIDDGRRLRRIGLLAATVAGIAVIGLAIALTAGTGEDPIQPLADLPDTAPTSGQSAEEPQSAAPLLPQRAADPDDSAAASMMRSSAPREIAAAPSVTAPSVTAPSPATPAQGRADITENETAQVSATALLRQMRSNRPDREDPAGTISAAADDTRLALIDSRIAETPTAIAENGPVSAPSRAAATPRPAAAPAATRIAVVAVGDPAIAGPMASEVESALRRDGRALADRRFISGFDQYLYDDGIDLAGLAEPAAEAGVRYVVMVRAVPTGSRELYYYGRYDTAWAVQIDAVTYDLQRADQIGSSGVDQLEYTSLNAAQKARDAVAPWLAPISRQFGR